MELGQTILNNEVQQQPPTKVEKTWFMQRENGAIIATSENDAYSMLHPTQFNAKHYKIVGVSDGRTYVDIIKNSAQEKIKLEEKVKTLSMNMTRYLKSLDSFKFEELLDDTSDKVIKVKGIISDLEKEIDSTNSSLANIQKSVVDRAFKAELEIAKGNIEQPRKNNVYCPGGNKDKVLRALNQ